MVCVIFDWLSNNSILSKLKPALIALYTVCFVSFLCAYFFISPVKFRPHSDYSVVLNELKTEYKDYETIYVDDIIYPVFLFEMQYPPESFQENAVYANAPAEFLVLARVEQYYFIVDYQEIDPNAVYCFPSSNEAALIRLIDAGFNIEEYGKFVIASPKNN